MTMQSRLHLLLVESYMSFTHLNNVIQVEIGYFFTLLKILLYVSRQRVV